MYIAFLKPGPQRTQADQWVPAPMAWIERGIASGTLLLAGSLDNGQGGVVLAAGMPRSELDLLIDADPFVAHGIVVPDVHAFAPSRMAKGMAALFDGKAT